MNNRWFRVAILLIAALVFFILSEYSSSISTWFTDREPNFSNVENKLNKDLADAQKYAQIILNKSDKLSVDGIYKFYYDSLSSSTSRKNISLFIFKGDELVLWTNNLDVQNLKSDSSKFQLTQIQNTWYVGQWIQGKIGRVLALLMLKHDYPYQNSFLKNIYNPRFSDLEGYSITLKQDDGEKKIRLSDGTSINIVKNKKINDDLPSIIKSILQCLSFLFILITAFIVLRHLFLKKRPFVYALSLTLTVAAIRIGGLLYGFPERGFGALFSPEIYAHSIFNPSLGDFLVNAILVFGVVLSIYRVINSSVTAIKYKYLWAIASSAITWGFFIIADSIFSSLVMHSTITLETYRVFNLSIYSLLGYIAVSFWIATALLLADLWTKIFKSIFDESKLALIALGGLIITFALVVSIGELPSIYGFLWSIITFSLLFWFRYRDLQLSSTWFLVIVGFLSFYSVFLVSDYSYRKDRDVRKMLAINLSNERDPVAEMLFGSLVKRLEADTTIHRYLEDIKKNDIEMYGYLQSAYFNGYFKKYDFRATVCYPGSDLIMDNSDHSVDCNGFFEDMINVYGIKIPGTTFYFLNTQNGRISYVGSAECNHKLKASRLYIEFDLKQNREILGYPELLLEGKYTGKSKLSTYSTAKYHNEQLIAQTGAYSYRLVNNFIPDTTQKFNFVNQSGYNHLVYRNDSDDIVILSRPRENLLNTTASFAYVFFFFYLTLMLWLKVALFPIKIGSRGHSFKLRIKSAMILVVVLSLILVASVSVYYSIQSFKKKNIDNLNEKLLSVMVDIERDITREDLLSSSYSDYLSNKLVQLSNIFYTDINLYDLSGSLVASSRPEIFERKLLGRKMNPIAWNEMAYIYNPRLIHEEQIGGMSYFSAYVPLVDQNSKTIAYLNLPYFTRQGELVEELYSIIVAILNIYVLLALFAFMVAIIISNQISKPLELIREKIRNVDISGHNEPIKYVSDDELGLLVKEYNRMVMELADSAEKLARSQRESAWREMAKQIAHEIKNPLTPMKLSLQHLVKTKREGVEDWDTLFQKFSVSLVDQINTLSNIATEFSNFAKMPASSIVEVKIDLIIDEVLTLFSGYSNIKFSYISSCGSSLSVKGDKEQLFRAFVNLVKNAVQSIEKGKRGEIIINISCSDANVLVAIEDNGKGIPEELQPKLFYPSFTTKSGGMGLGLAIVKGIVENTGGRVWFETTVGVGTKFFVELPLVKD